MKLIIVLASLLLSSQSNYVLLEQEPDQPSECALWSLPSIERTRDEAVFVEKVIDHRLTLPEALTEEHL